MGCVFMNGLFVGLTTLDLIYRAAAPPTANQKVVASEATIAAGGPATNAAVTFSHLGNQATVLSVLGQHTMARLIQADLCACSVELVDLEPGRSLPPPISSIIVTEASGERAVISINAAKSQAVPDHIPANCLEGVDVVLIDGHQMAVARAIAQQAKTLGIPVVVDAGSWKPGFETVLSWVDYAICSANFHPPGCTTDADVAAYLQSLGITHIAITHGEQPIAVWHVSTAATLPVPSISAVDTLGAGDIFHGAFCHFILQSPFAEALAQAAEVAAYACQFFGTRQWLISEQECGSLQRVMGTR